MADKEQKSKPDRLRRGAIWFGLGLLTIVMSVLFFPPINRGWQEITCLWSQGRRCDPPSSQAFKADQNGFCSLGDVGTLLKKAQESGDIDTRPNPREEMALRTRLCTDFIDEKIRPAVEHLEHLANRFDTCFVFDDHALRDGNSGLVTNRFEVDPDSNSICTVPVAWINGKRTLIKRDDPGVVLCLPFTTVSGGPSQESTELRFCAAAELQSIGIEKSWVDQIMAVVNGS